MRIRRYALTRAAITLLCAAVASTFAPAQDGLSDEYEIRAAMIFNLTRFVDWPATRTASRDFVLCEMGADPVVLALEHSVRGKTVGDKAVVVRRLAKTDNVSSCHLLYVAGNERKSFEAIAAAARRDGVLTVGAQEWFLAAGGVVNLPMVADRIHIQIQMNNAQQGGWTISSKLLRLAEVVR